MKNKMNIKKPLLGFEPRTLRLLSACSNQLSYNGVARFEKVKNKKKFYTSGSRHAIELNFKNPLSFIQSA